MEIDCVSGIYDWERKVTQKVVLDIEMAFDNRIPAASDDIAATLDYKAVSKRLIAFVGASPFGMVESLAERCAEIVCTAFGVRLVRPKLSKPGAVTGSRSAGVIHDRGQRSSENR